MHTRGTHTPRWQLRLAYVIALLLILLIVSGCASNSPVGDFCHIYLPVYDVDNDLVHYNNGMYKELCL